MGWLKIRDEDKVREEVEEAVRLQIEELLRNRTYRGVLADGSQYRVDVTDYQIDEFTMHWEWFEVID